MATDSTELAKRLARLNKADLIDLVMELHGRHPDSDSRIDRYLLRNTPEALATSLQRSIQQHARSRRFIEYSASFAYAAQLQQLLADIEKALLPQYPRQAIPVITDFIATHERVLLRSDDSAAVIMGVYREATGLLCQAIELARQQQEYPDGYWLNEFDQWRKRDPYYLYLAMLEDTGNCLSQEELKRLAWRFQQQLKAPAAKRSHDEDQKLAEASLGLKGVAKALARPDLYAEALESLPAPLSAAQRIEIAENYLNFSQPGKAITVLKEEQSNQRNALELLSRAYSMQGDSKGLQNSLQDLFYLEPSTENFQALLDASPAEEHPAILSAAIEKAEQADNVTLAANLLLELNKPEKAMRLLLRQGTQLQQYYYGDLLALTDSFREKQMPLGAILCYRALLEDILNRAYSKAYIYAADYVQALLELDQQCDDYLHLPDHSQYLHQLRQQHRNKPGFWTRVDGSVLLKGI